MSIRKSVIYQPGFWFLTITCTDFLPLIETVNGYDIVYNWFNHLKRQGQGIAGYVIMPNHMHVLVTYRNNAQSLNTLVANGKRFMAYEIVRRLKDIGREDFLNILAKHRTDSEIKAGKQHRVFELSFDAKNCSSSRFLSQKLNYIHNNPCNKKWMLSKDIVSYPHSSAHFYFTGRQGLYDVEHVMAVQAEKWLVSEE